MSSREVDAIRREPLWHGADALAFAVLLLAWLGAVLAIGLHGAFPQNDGWAYARVVQGLLENGRVERIPFLYASLITHAWLGALASWQGFSFEALRLVGVVSGGVGMIATHALVREMGGSVRRAAFAALLVGFNPVYLNLSFTYMSEPPFVALVTLSLVALVRGLVRDSMGWLAVGVAVGIAATMTRQPALAIAAALGIALIATRFDHARALVLAGAVLVSLLAFVALPPLLLGACDPGTETFLGFLRYALPEAIPRYGRHGLGSIVYLGAFLSPVALWLLVARHAGGRARALAFVAGAAVGTLALVARAGLPEIGNTIHAAGLGPAEALADHDAVSTLPAAWFAVATLVAGGLGGVLVHHGAAALWRERGALRQRADIVLLLGFCTVYLGVLLLKTPFFDRYWLPVLPPLLALLAATRPRAEGRAAFAGAVAGVVLAVLATVSVLGTRDYLERDRARWALLDELLEAGVPSDQIDGGNEFNGWHNYVADPDRFVDREQRWVVDDVYRVSHAERLEGYEAHARAQYRRLLAGGWATLTVHRRSIDDPP